MGVILNLRTQVEDFSVKVQTFESRLNSMVDAINAQNTAILAMHLPWWKWLFKKKCVLQLTALTLPVVIRQEIREVKVHPGHNVSGASVIGE